MSISPTSPSHHYFSSCSTAEDSIISSPPIIPHSNLGGVPPRSGGYVASPNTSTSRTSASASAGIGDQIRRNSAVETSQDKIDDNSYGAWWFFSNSDSFGFGNTPEKKPPQQPPPPPPPPMPGTIDENENGRMQIQAEDVTIITSPTTSIFEEDMRSDGWMDQITAPKATTKSSASGVWEAAPMTDAGMPINDNAKLNATSAASPPNAPVMGGNYTFKEQKLLRMQNESWVIKNNINVSLGGSGGESSTVQIHENYSSNGLVLSSAAGTYVPPSYNDQSSMKPVSFSIGNAEEDDWDMTMAANYERRRRKQEDSIEWTPPDSSYGAAIPACGWIPKRVRKSLEVVFFALSVALLIFVLVKAGLELRSGGSGTTTSSSSSSSGSASDTDSFGEYIRNDDHVNENAGNNAGNVNDNGRNN